MELAEKVLGAEGLEALRVRAAVPSKRMPRLEPASAIIEELDQAEPLELR